jgi:hypothetical protein
VACCLYLCFSSGVCAGTGLYNGNTKFETGHQYNFTDVSQVLAACIFVACLIITINGLKICNAILSADCIKCYILRLIFVALPLILLWLVKYLRFV